MTTNPVAEFLRALQENNLLEPARFAEAELLAAQETNRRRLAKELVRRGLLTKWQAQMIAASRAAELRLGSYILLAEVGKGGMGRVYKARHHLMGRIVALKAIKKRRLGDPDAVRRFQREIQAAAQLTHPNVVMAFDADQHGDLQYFAMEFVDGVDLGRLVKEKGPLPVREACEYIRQAAIGLQHAHERGLVHRDIKPSNLLLTLAKVDAVRASLSGVLSTPASDPSMGSGALQGVIKISDFGLARVPAALPPDQDPTNITDEGFVVGTPDFVSPEQARNARRVDIRSDLYSLGCTFFYLLTGQSPFPDGTPTEKLLKHVMDPPPDVRSLRPEKPPEVAAIIQKLLAKSPADRFQTPGELALALEPYALDSSSSTRSASYLRLPATATTDDESTETAFGFPSLTVRRLEDERARRAARVRRRTDWGLWIPLALGFLLLAALLVVFISSWGK